MEKIVASLGLKLSARDSRFTDPKAYLQAILRQWLPLSDAILKMVSLKLPSPLEMAEERVEKLMSGGLRKFDSLPQETRELKPGINSFCIFLKALATEVGLLLFILHYSVSEADNCIKVAE